MSNLSKSPAVLVRGSVSSNLNVTANTTHTEPTYLPASRVSSYLTDLDYPVPHATISQHPKTEAKTVAISVPRMKNKLHDFDATFHHNNDNGSSS
ncbi:uncharacterized protein EAF02_011229 [Botrytis sinoallii]|uniref:uncharacterized protein n=1 Tax=Botrytis sinoallii TaxID=1463999 RepID=UPI0019001AF8|nr:uncharacterized protein EAF02_011229 [Botrytis sinoallii]KAF7857862.1 hypothetical protein EAF02_011229 [Botrytis sinoallii]